MGRRNGEHYLDLTAYQAIKNIEGYKKQSKQLNKYTKEKIKMLNEDFLIKLTKDDLDNLFSLNSEEAIDRKVINIIIDKL